MFTSRMSFLPAGRGQEVIFEPRRGHVCEPIPHSHWIPNQSILKKYQETKKEIGGLENY
jgi:hypothetical protein